MLGFPISLLNIQDPEIDFAHALVRKGVIAQKNLITKRLIIDSAIYNGNSGAPVLIVEHPQPNIAVFKIGGVIIKYVAAKARVTLTPNTTNDVSVEVNSGYGVAEPIDYAIELLNQFPAD